MTEALSLGHAAICLKDDVMMHHSLSHEMCMAGIMDDVLLVHTVVYSLSQQCTSRKIDNRAREMVLVCKSDQLLCYPRQS